MRRLLFLLTVLLIATASFSQSGKKKIVLIPGHDSHGLGEHEHLGGCTLLAKWLNENVPNVNAVVADQGWPKDTTILDDAASIVMYSDGGDGHMAIPHLAHLSRLMDKGVGLLNLHYAVEVPKGEVGDDFKKWVGGYFETFYSVNPTWTAKFTSLPKHPSTNGVKPFETTDEWYFHMRFVENDKNLVPILVAVAPASTMDRKDGSHEGNPDVREAVSKKEPQVMGWAYTRPNGGRGYGITGAHSHDNWMNDDFRKLVLNAIVWTAHINVPKDGVKSTTPTKAELDAVRKDPNNRK